MFCFKTHLLKPFFNNTAAGVLDTSFLVQLFCSSSSSALTGINCHSAKNRDNRKVFRIAQKKQESDFLFFFHLAIKPVPEVSVLVVNIVGIATVRTQYMADWVPMRR